VISLQTHRGVLAPAGDQQVEDLSRLRAAVDIIAEENVDSLLGQKTFKGSVDPSEHFGEQVCATMDIANRIDPYSFRHAGCPQTLRSRFAPKKHVGTKWELSNRTYRSVL
jgi:hypothetical protein